MSNTWLTHLFKISASQTLLIRLDKFDLCLYIEQLHLELEYSMVAVPFIVPVWTNFYFKRPFIPFLL